MIEIAQSDFRENIVVYCVDRQCKLISWDKGYHLLYEGLGIELYSGFDTLQFTEESTASHLRTDIARSFEGESFKVFRQFNFRGLEFCALLTFKTQVNSYTKEIECVEITGRDFTELMLYPDRLDNKRLHYTILKREKQYRSFGYSSRERVIAFNDDFLIIDSANYSMNARQENFIGQNLLDLVASEDIPLLNKAWIAIKGKPEASEVLESIQIVINGHATYYDGMLVNLCHDRDVNGYVLRLFEVTERKIIKKSLEEVNEELDTFIYHASHDIRAPLLSVIGLVNVALNEHPLYVKEYLSLIRSSVLKVDRFIVDLNHYYQNERDGFSPVVINVRDMFKELTADLSHLSDFSLVSINLNLLKSPLVICDVFRLKLIVRNLLSNAIEFADFNKSVPFVNLQVESLQDYFIISVKDNGIGVRKEFKHRVFDLFFRGTERSKGSGVGLYIVKKIVKKLNGQIDMFSELGEGTTMVVTLPQMRLSQGANSNIGNREGQFVSAV